MDVEVMISQQLWLPVQDPQKIEPALRLTWKE